MTNGETFRDVTALRRAVRALAHHHRLPAEVRGRLVLSVTELAAGQFEAGHHVELTATCHSGTGHDSAQLVVTLTAPQAAAALPCDGLALPAPTTTANSATWRTALLHPPGRLPTPRKQMSPGWGTGAQADADAQADAEEEMRAALALADSLAADHRLLKHELAETNAGVLALYVQLAEQEEQLRSAHGRVLRELEDALRPPPPRVDGLELAVHYAPADPAAPTGGDLYDWFVLPDGTVHVTVVDALGHGVTSTRSAITVTHAVRALALEGHSLQSLLARTHHLLQPIDADLMATVLLGRLDPAAGELQLANGSHPPALLLRADGTAHYLEVKGRGIGFPSPGSDTVLTVPIAPGDLLLLYTDGLTESRRDMIEGERRLIRALRDHAHLPVAEIPGAVAADMHTIVHHADDTLALAFRMRGPTGEPDRHPGSAPSRAPRTGTHERAGKRPQG
ncbi:PP2C family protein-serine/threonine phosphatase [Streptomyces sp. NPDC001674]|uniref:PP2C family protein-serine/threonine phosphatase n=1 Tax=Streptomyces sp. NPDC001674 TaxID=3154394 RepID=UPI00332F703A